MQLALPVRLIVAIPEKSGGTTRDEDLARARQKGVGVIEVAGESGTVLVNSLSLSLAAVHPIPRHEFPEKYRYHLSQAENTFKEGNPAKGCDDVYGLIEELSRKVARKTFRKGLWKAGTNPPNFATGPWASVMDNLIRNLDTGRCKLFKDNILHHILAITPYRNQVVHVPDSVTALIRRDRLLRTRFEDAANLLLDLIKMAKPLKV